MNSLLVANRGEIAVRVIRTARERGMRTIAVYSELDRDALHTHLADEAWNIGGAPAAQSYLNADRILAVARESGARAIHPGYGFLAENASFARRVTESGITWVGPPASAIELMGNKILSRRTAERAGVAPVPGTTEPVAGFDEAAPIADRIGYPVAVKAAHGGGGEGTAGSRRPQATGGRHRRRPTGGGCLLRESHRLPRSLSGQATAHRGPDHRGSPRQRTVPGRARLLRAAAPPETDRRSSLDRPLARGAPFPR